MTLEIGAIFPGAASWKTTIVYGVLRIGDFNFSSKGPGLGGEMTHPNGTTEVLKAGESKILTSKVTGDGDDLLVNAS